VDDGDSYDGDNEFIEAKERMLLEDPMKIQVQMCQWKEP
jgi:hypothetical protein